MYIKGAVFSFKRNVEGKQFWTEGTDCEANIIEHAGATFVELRCRRPDRPSNKLVYVPLHEIDQITHLEDPALRASTDRKPAFVASEAPGGTVPNVENVPRRGRPPKAAVE